MVPTGKKASTAASALTHGGRRAAASTELPQRANAPSTSEVWQARIGSELAAQLRLDAEVLGLNGRTEIVKAALDLLHRHAAEQQMAQSVDDFYGASTPPLPVGVPDGDDGDS